MSGDWSELAKKRRSLKVLNNVKYKKGGAVSGEKSVPSLGKNTRGAEKTQDEQKTAWDGFKKGGGIHIKKENKGKLHKELGVPEGKKIPEKKLEKAKNSSSPAERKRATFAENAKHWNHK